MSSSINVPQYQPGPRFEAHKTPGQHKIRQRLDTVNNEIPQAARLVAPAPETLPAPEKLVQEVQETRRREKPSFDIKETVRSVNNNKVCITKSNS